LWLEFIVIQISGQSYGFINRQVATRTSLTDTLGVVIGVHVEAGVTGTRETASRVPTHLLTRV